MKVDALVKTINDLGKVSDILHSPIAEGDDMIYTKSDIIEATQKLSEAIREIKGLEVRV